MTAYFDPRWSKFHGANREAMDEAQFWTLIEATKQASGGDVDAQMKLLDKELYQLTPEELLGFDRILAELLMRAYSYDLWAACYIFHGGCSDDAFEYFRSGLILQGKAVFDNALRDPETLVELNLSDDDLDVQTLYSATWDPYKEKTGEDLPANFMYPDTWPGELKGERWSTDEELDEKYPKLSIKSKNWSLTPELVSEDFWRRRGELDFYREHVAKPTQLPLWESENE